MPLSFKIRDEENERINNILKRLMGLDYVPDNGNAVIDEMLADIGLKLQTLLDFSTNEVILYLEKSNFDWVNAEQFADLLFKLSAKLPESKFFLAEKASVIYEYIQTESKTFSWDIAQKIANTTGK
jgi:hypothetical protein